MALPNHLSDRENQKFRDTGTPGQTKIGVEIENSSPISVTGTLSVTPSVRSEYLNAEDTTETYTYAGFGTANERITLITYTAPSVGAQTVYKTFNYTQVGGKYRLDSVVWTLV